MVFLESGGGHREEDERFSPNKGPFQRSAETPERKSESSLFCSQTKLSTFILKMFFQEYDMKSVTYRRSLNNEDDSEEDQEEEQVITKSRTLAQRVQRTVRL